jgi:hypothetical protein
MVIKIEMHVRQGAELGWGDEERAGAQLLVWLWGLGPRSFLACRGILGDSLGPPKSAATISGLAGSKPALSNDRVVLMRRLYGNGACWIISHCFAGSG